MGNIYQKEDAQGSEMFKAAVFVVLWVGQMVCTVLKEPVQATSSFMFLFKDHYGEKQLFTVIPICLDTGKSVSVSTQDGIVALGKVHARSTLSQ